MNDNNTVQPSDDGLTERNQQQQGPPDSILDTTVVPGGSGRLREKSAHPEQPPHGDTPLSGDVHRIVLVIRGMRHEILLGNEESLVMGRLDQRSSSRPDIDLTPFGGATRGVSREHVRLTVHDRHLYLTDLGSTNGSLFKGERLAADEPRLLHNGDEVVLGRLAIRFILDDSDTGTLL